MVGLYYLKPRPPQGTSTHHRACSDLILSVLYNASGNLCLLTRLLHVHYNTLLKGYHKGLKTGHPLFTSINAIDTYRFYSV